MQYLASAALFLAAAVLAAPADPAPSVAPLSQRWLYLNVSGDFVDDGRTDAAIALVRRAMASGYNGAILDDVGLGYIERQPPEYLKNARRFVKAARDLKFQLTAEVTVPYGERIFRHDPHLAEGLL